MIKQVGTTTIVVGAGTTKSTRMDHRIKKVGLSHEAVEVRRSRRESYDVQLVIFLLPVDTIPLLSRGSATAVATDAPQRNKILFHLESHRLDFRSAFYATKRKNVLLQERYPSRVEWWRRKAKAAESIIQSSSCVLENS